jgi:hypothetical protein
MYRLLGHGAAKVRSSSGHALGRARTGKKTGEYGCWTQFFVWRSGAACRFWFASDSVVGKRRNRMFLVRVSPVQSRLFLGHCFGANATPDGKLALLLRLRRLRLRFPPSADPP